MKKTMENITRETIERARISAINDATGAKALAKAEAEALKAKNAAKAKRAKADALAAKAKRAKADGEGEAETAKAIREAQRADIAADEAADEAKGKAEAARVARENADALKTDKTIIITFRALTPFEVEERRAARVAREKNEDARNIGQLAPSHALAAFYLDEVEAEADEARNEAEAAREAARSVEALKAKNAAPRLSFFVGGLSVVFAYNIAEAVALRLRLTNIETSVVFNPRFSAEAFDAAAKHIAKAAIKAATQRQGTPFQFRLRAAALRGAWYDNDACDIYAASAEAYTIATATPARLQGVRAEADALIHEAARLRSVGLADTEAREVILNEAREAAPTLASEDAKTARSRADALRAALAAADAKDEAEAARLAALAAFRFINRFLADARAIRSAANNEALNVDSLADVLADTRIIDADSLTEYEARRREIIREAWREAAPKMTPATLRSVRALWRCNGSIRAAAKATKRHPKTTATHRANAARILAYTLTKTAGDSFEAFGFERIAEAASEAVEVIKAEAALNKARAKAEDEAEAARARVFRASCVTCSEAREAAATPEEISAEAAALAALNEARARLQEREKAITATAEALARNAEAEALAEAAKAEALKDAKRRAAFAEALATVYADLPPAMRETVRLASEGVALRDIARRLNKAPATIHKAKARACQLVARAFAEYAETAPKAARLAEYAEALANAGKLADIFALAE